MASAGRRLGSLVALAVLLAVLATSADAGVTSQYRRRLEATDDMPLNADVFRVPPGINPVQQVHITLGDQTGTAMIVSWATGKLFPGGTKVTYGTALGNQNLTAFSNPKRYTYNTTYTSGYIHNCTLTNLEPGRKYYYTIGFGIFQKRRTFNFTTPPKPGPDVPFKFGIIGDLGQTFESNNTLSHYQANKGDAVLYLGDLSYADYYEPIDQKRWDTWGRFIERSAAYQPWLWTVGNHEEELDEAHNETVAFKSFTHRYPTPYQAAGSSEPFWYSVKLASAHIIVLACYSDYSEGSSQWRWLQAELKRVDRKTTPWLIVLMHAPWYNSNTAHYREFEDMRVQFESWLVNAKADVVLAGHVHAYERSYRISNITKGFAAPVRNRNAPVYLNIGDGGNIEGIEEEWNRQPSYSASRESSFG
ncbi:hypothetical protein ACP70R_044336 [Stipagrostis hirtigluma subsp. patula]